MKIAISSGHGKYVRGASGYIDEVDEARRVVDAVASLLGDAGVEVESFHDNTSTTQNQKTDLLFAGTTMIVAGIAAGIYGGSLLIRSKHAAQDASREPTPAGSADAVTKTAQASFASSPTFLLPVVGARF